MRYSQWIALMLLVGTAQAQTPPYMRKAKEIQAEAREIRDQSRSNPQTIPDANPAPQKPARVAQKSQAQKAAASGSVHELELLEAKGENMNSADGDGSTPLHMAAYKGQASAVEYLLARPGMFKDPIDNRGYTPLTLAASAGHAEVVDLLLAAGCNPNIACGDGGTALHKAAGQGHLRVVESLLKAGADPRLADRSGKTPLQLAQDKRKGDWDRVVNKLEEALNNAP